MLQIPKFSQSVNFTSPDHPVRVVTGRKLNRLIKKASARDRCLIAVDIAQGVMQIRELTYGQAAALARVATSYVATVGALAPEDRVQLARGQLSLPVLHNSRRNVDAEIERIITRHGTEVVWRAFDRLTAPPVNGNGATITKVTAAE